MRRLTLVVLALAATIVGVPTAAARPTLTCRSADMRYAFVPGGAKNFGVYNLTITGGSCTTARSVAKAWMKRFEASVMAGNAKTPKRVLGFTFVTLPTSAAQTYRERGRKATTSIRFDYRVPNG